MAGPMRSTLEKAVFNRTELLLGPEAMELFAEARVIIFGVGGVGSWCAEGLVRSGIRHLTLVDSDCVCITNVNRQRMATTRTVGKVKVDVLREQLLEINPKAEIEAIQAIYTDADSERFHLDSYDYIIDAIDSLKDKASLILRATATRATFFSSMGAACKIDPTGVRVAEFWDVRGCPLGAALRKKLRKAGTLPAKKFLCVYDEEVLPNRGKKNACGTEHCICPKKTEGDPSLAGHEWCSAKAQINGTLAHITALFGFTLSGLVISDLCSPDKSLSKDN